MVRFSTASVSRPGHLDARTARLRAHPALRQRALIQRALLPTAGPGQLGPPAGDVDADGYDDFLVGAYYNDNGASSNSGATYLVFGAARPASTDLSDTVKFTGEGSSDYSGWAVGPAGDVDADGFADFLIGAYGNETAYLIFGTGL